MKKFKLVLISVISLNFGFSPLYAQAIVNDPINNVPIVSNWLTAVDTLYSNYDMVMNLSLIHISEPTRPY